MSRVRLYLPSPLSYLFDGLHTGVVLIVCVHVAVFVLTVFVMVSVYLVFVSVFCGKVVVDVDTAVPL